MKKALTCVAILAAVCGISSAGMNDRDFAVSVIGTATGTVTYVLRGELYGMYVDIAAGSTQSVVVASAEQTLLNISAATADAWYPLRYQQKGSTGSNITNEYGAAPMAGAITLTVTGASGQTATNATTVTVVYDQ